MAARFDPSRGTAEPLGAIPGAEEMAALMAAAEIAKWFFRHRARPRRSHPDHRPAGLVLAGPPGDPASRLQRLRQGRKAARGAAGTETPRDRVRCGRRLENGPARRDRPRLRASHEPVDGHHRLPDSPTPMRSARDGAMSRRTSRRPRRRTGCSTCSRRSAAAAIGKGMTGDQAQASALCEAVERYSARNQRQRGAAARHVSRPGAGRRHPPQRGDEFQRPPVPEPRSVERPSTTRRSTSFRGPWATTSPSTGARHGRSRKGAGSCCRPRCCITIRGARATGR